MTALEKSQELFKELQSLRPLSAEDEQRIMQKFRLDWNYHSNHLEGNQLTFGETKAFILFHITAQGKPFKDYIEMRGHNEAIELIVDVIKESRPLTENFIRHLHELLLKESYQVDAETPDGNPTKKLIQVGKYKETPNHVKTKTGEVFRFATPEETPAQMYDLLKWFRAEQEKKEKNAIILAAEFHYRFIRIHPFDDGNGRMARILMNFILMSYHYPPVVIKTEDKENYFSTLRLADAGQLEPFVNYITENLNHSLELMIKGAKGESVEEDDDLEKEIVLLEQKINSIGKKREKSISGIKKLIQTSVVPLFDLYQQKMKTFERFYSQTILDISVQGDSFKIQKHLNLYDLPSFSEQLNLGIDTQIWITYNFKGPIRENLKFDYSAYISIALNPFSLEIESTSGKQIKLSYGDSLSDSEIQDIVRNEMVRHKNQLENFIRKGSL